MRTREEQRLFNTYRYFNQVAYNPNNRGHQRLQRLGVQVENHFASFHQFLTWVRDTLGPAPSSEHKIIRKDQTKGFKPSNLQWGLCEEVAHAFYMDHRIAYRGKRLNLCQWAKVLDLPATTLYSRYSLGVRKPKELFAPKKSAGRPTNAR